MKKKGVSGIIATVLLIGIAVIAVSMIWVVVNNLIREKTDTANACFGNFGKVEINRLYTCYNSSSGNLHFSLKIGDIDVDSVLVAVLGEGTTKSFEILNSSSTISGVTNYPDGSSSVQLPSKNAGLTYIYDLTGQGFLEVPDRVEISPTIDGEQCEVSDFVYGIENC